MATRPAVTWSTNPLAKASQQKRWRSCRSEADESIWRGRPGRTARDRPGHFRPLGAGPVAPGAAWAAPGLWMPQPGPPEPDASAERDGEGEHDLQSEPTCLDADLLVQPRDLEERPWSGVTSSSAALTMSE